MTGNNNLSPLLFDTNDKPHFLKSITITKEMDHHLRSARALIRKHLEKNIAPLLALKYEEDGVDNPKFKKPGFFTQGSFAYQTINRPCRSGQQCDLDDGMYLVREDVEQISNAEKASSIILDAVKVELQELVEKRSNWKLITKNPNCARIEINDEAHIDIPVYVIPRAEYDTLEAAADAVIIAKSMNRQEFTIVSLESYAVLDSAHPDYFLINENYLEEIEQSSWQEMPKGQVYMLTRDVGYRKSDPRPVVDWVNERVQIKTEQYRRLVRYIKAWRDYQVWPEDDPKSILLMFATNQAMSIHHPPMNPPSSDAKDYRDDEALLSTLQNLANVLHGVVPNAASEEQEDLAKIMSVSVRKTVIRKIEDFAADLKRALHTSDAKECISLLRRHLGGRIPDRQADIAKGIVFASNSNPVTPLAPTGPVVSA